MAEERKGRGEKTERERERERTQHEFDTNLTVISTGSWVAKCHGRIFKCVRTSPWVVCLLIYFLFLSFFSVSLSVCMYVCLYATPLLSQWQGAWSESEIRFGGRLCPLTRLTCTHARGWFDRKWCNPSIHTGEVCGERGIAAGGGGRETEMRVCWV